MLSEFPGHLAEAARARRDSLLVVIGGDGTMNEVVNGVAGTDAELAVLPSGTGQDFGRTHGIPTGFDDAVRVALDGETRVIDLGRVELESGTSRYFANVGSAGMSGAVARRANSMSKAFGGRATFFYALTREFLAWQNTEVVVRARRTASERRGAMHDVIVANGHWHGGGMKLAPDARQDDGLFDVVLIGDVNKLDFLTTAPKLYSGRYLSHPKVDLLQSRPWRSTRPSRCRSRWTASRSARRRRASRSSQRRCGCVFPLRSLAAAAAAAFGALAGLVAAGAMTGLDQWACRARDAARGTRRRLPPTSLESLVPLLHAPLHPVGVAIAEIVTLPGQVVISLVLVLAAARRLWKRGRVEAAVCWTAAWFVAVAVELVFRHTLTRPALYRDGVHLVAIRLVLAERARAALRARRGRARRRRGRAYASPSRSGSWPSSCCSSSPGSTRPPTSSAGCSSRRPPRRQRRARAVRALRRRAALRRGRAGT